MLGRSRAFGAVLGCRTWRENREMLTRRLELGYEDALRVRGQRLDLGGKGRRGRREFGAKLGRPWFTQGTMLGLG